MAVGRIENEMNFKAYEQNVFTCLCWTKVGNGNKFVGYNGRMQEKWVSMETQIIPKF